jgi:hypothetical protein
MEGVEGMKKPANLRDSMQKTAEWVEEKRKEHGLEHVNSCIRRALKGEPGLFYAMENGHVLGTPFQAPDFRHQWQGIAVINGTTFAAFIVEPSEASALPNKP